MPFVSTGQKSCIIFYIRYGTIHHLHPKSAVCSTDFWSIAKMQFLKSYLENYFCIIHLVLEKAALESG